MHKYLINDFTITILESAGLIALAMAAVSIAATILTKKDVNEIGMSVLPVLAGLGWFGT